MNRSTHRSRPTPQPLTPRRWTLQPWMGGRGVGLLLIALILAVLAPNADAQRRSDPLADLDRDQRRVFKAYTRLFCAQFFRYGEDRFVILPNYYNKRENSTGRSYDQAKELMTEVKREKRGFSMVEVKYPPPEAEVVAAAKILPAMDVGHYGYINKVRVKEIVGPEEMIVSNIELIPPDIVGREKNATRVRLAELQRTLQYQTYRVLGFRTKDLREGQEYQGPDDKGLHVAVMSTGQKHAFVLVNYDRLDRVRTHEFPEALAYVKLSPLAFIDLVRDNRERLLSEGDKASLISIYRRFYNRYRPTQVSTKPTVVRPEPKPKPEKPEQEEESPGGRDYERRIETGEPEEEQEKPGGGDTETPAEDEPEEQDTRPEPVEEDDEPEDDWEYEEKDSPGDIDFFGIPLGD